MLEHVRLILQGVAERLQLQVTPHLPALVSAAVILVTASLIAVLARWLLLKVLEGSVVKALAHTGITFVLDYSRRLRAAKIVSAAAFWLIFAVGVLVALSVFTTTAPFDIAHGVVVLLPRIVVTGLILLGGTWLIRYLGRSMLVWAVNEGIAEARRLTTAVRAIGMLGTVVVAADYLNFVKDVFFAVFVILVGGVVLTTSLAVGIGASGRVRRFFSRQRIPESSEESERSLWSHL